MLGRPDARASGRLDVRTPAPLFFQFLRSSRRGPDPGRAVAPAAPRHCGAGPRRDERKNCEKRTKNDRKIRFWLAIFSHPPLICLELQLLEVNETDMLVLCHQRDGEEETLNRLALHHRHYQLISRLAEYKA